MSSTTMPVGGLTPTFAAGHINHHRVTVPGSLVASSLPRIVRGCFPGWSQPRFRHEHPVGPAGVCSGNTSAPPAA
jgi:hypothetical protein